MKRSIVKNYRYEVFKFIIPFKKQINKLTERNEDLRIKGGEYLVNDRMACEFDDLYE